MSDEGPPSPSIPPSRRGRRLWDRTFGRFPPFGWLLALVAIYVVATATLSWCRALDFQTTTWDMGIYQQALWSGAHGRGFYEAPDFETGGFGSFLQVHSSFILYAVAPVYAAIPSQATLFVVQSLAVGLAAVPLYQLARVVGGSSGYGLAAGGIYLVWAPTIASNLYDFHAEAFLPLEIFSFLFLWTKGRYRLGFLAAFVASITFELAPVLLFFAGLFFLFPAEERIWSWLSGLRATGFAKGIGRALRTAVEGARSLRVRASLLLMASMVAAYGLLLWAREYWIGPLLGVGPFPSSASASGYVVGSTLPELGLSLANLTPGLTMKCLYWLTALALLGFVPLLAPRAWILSVPWLGFTFLSANLNYVTPGFQYGFILACGLLPAFAFGLPRLVRGTRRAVATLRVRGERGRPTDGPKKVDRLPWAPVAVALALGILVVVNLAASPLDPALEDQPSLGAAYYFSYHVPTGFGAATRLVGQLPAGAYVIASFNLFPLVANDEHAYSLIWVVEPLATPFNATHLPEYALLSSTASYATPPWLSNATSDPSQYQLMGQVFGTGAGTITLYQTVPS